MGAGISIRIEDGEVKALLRSLQARVKDLTPAMRIVGNIVRSSVVRNFEEGGRPKKWQPHAEATILGGIRKKDFTRKGALRAGASKRLRGGRVLIRKGRLMKSIKYKAYTDRVEVGTNVIYAAIHQFGGKAGRKSRRVQIPARPYLMVQDEDWPEMRDAIADYITKRRGW